MMVVVNRRTRRRERKLKDAEEARIRFRFGLLADEALREHSFDDLGFQVVDVQVLPALDGSPGGMSAFLIFPTAQAAQAAREPGKSAQLLQRARDVLAASGFPADALAGFDLAYTSLPEIEAAGGRFAYFR